MQEKDRIACRKEKDMKTITGNKLTDKQKKYRNSHTVCRDMIGLNKDKEKK